MGVWARSPRTLKLSPPPYPKAKPILVFNSLTWKRDAVITLSLSNIDPDKKQSNWLIYSPDQQIIPSQNTLETLEEKASHQLLFLASNIPALGYQYYWIQPHDAHISLENSKEYVLENQFLKAIIHPAHRTDRQPHRKVYSKRSLQQPRQSTANISRPKRLLGCLEHSIRLRKALITRSQAILNSMDRERPYPTKNTHYLRSRRSLHHSRLHSRHCLAHSRRRKRYSLGRNSGSLES